MHGSRLSSRARGSMTNGRLTTMVSADASFLVSCPLFVDSLRSSFHH
jgi:hypothetical protein